MKKYDIIVIGMGPAGMAVSAMASSMGLKVLSIEKNKVGGECLNCGCIPSKALLKAGDANFIAQNLKKYGIDAKVSTDSKGALNIVRKKIGGIVNNKFMKVFEKVDLKISEGDAWFKDEKTVILNGEEYTAKKIFIATGTEPFIPPIEGIENVPKLTNVNLFEQKDIPKSMIVIGGGAIGTEMAQAFNNLGAKVTIIHMDKNLLPAADEEAGLLLEDIFKERGINVINNAKIERWEKKKGRIILHYEDKKVEAEKLLVAAGRKPALEALKLENAGIKTGKKGIIVNQHLRTNKKNIYAVGDCNGISLFSHSAMHQGMLALMASMSPFPLSRLKRSKYAVPWSVFTRPEVAQVGLTEKEAAEKGLKFQVTKKEYQSYGRTVADGHPEGFIKIVSSKSGEVYGATIVGEAASELIHEWTMAIQFKIKLHQIMMMQHSFPTISMLNKMVTEDWLMGKMDSKFIQKWAKRMI